jgi:uncharacterized protein DUF4328
MSPPPGYVAYGTPGAHGGAFRSVGRISKAMIVLLWIYLPLQLLTIFDQLRLRRQAQRFLDGAITEQKFRDSVRVNASSLVGILVVPIAVLTMIWMFRMAANLRRMGRPGQTWGPGWGIGGWFVPPFVVYAVPWLMFRELWRGSDPNLAADNPDWKRTRVPALVNVWWVLYGFVPLIGIFSASGVGGPFPSGMSMTSLAKQFRDFVGLNIALTVVAMVATVVYLRIVRQLSARHMQMTREAA